MVFQCKKVNTFYQILAQELKSTQENHFHYRFALFCHSVLTQSLNIKLQVQCLSFKTAAIPWGRIWYGKQDILSTGFSQRKKMGKISWILYLASKKIKALHICNRGFQRFLQTPWAWCCRIYGSKSLLMVASTSLCWLVQCKNLHFKAKSVTFKVPLDQKLLKHAAYIFRLTFTTCS